MPNSQSESRMRLVENAGEQEHRFQRIANPNSDTVTVNTPAGNEIGQARGERAQDPLLTVAEVAERLNVTKDWVWDHSSRKAPYLPAIRMGDGTLRYRASRIEAFIDDRERLTVLRRRRA